MPAAIFACTDLIVIDPASQRLSVGVEQHVEHRQPVRGEAGRELAPVVVIQDRLHHDEAVGCVIGHLASHGWHEPSPRREVLEVAQHDPLQVGSEHVANRLGVEVAATRSQLDEPVRGRRLPDPERTVDPHMHVVTVGDDAFPWSSETGRSGGT